MRTLSQESVRYAAPLLCLTCLGCGVRKPSSVPPAIPPHSPPSPQPSATPVQVSGELSGARTVFSDGKGNRRLELTGIRTTLAPGATGPTLEGTRAVIYQNGKPVLTVGAKNVRIEARDQKLSKLVAQGRVSAQTPDARILRCDTLTWIPGTNLVRALGTPSLGEEIGTLQGVGSIAFVSGESFALYGSRFTADTLLRTLKILP